MPEADRGKVPARNRIVACYLVQGAAGLLVLLWMSWARNGEPARVLAALEPSGLLLLSILFLLSLAFSALKFPLTEEIFSSLAILAFVATVPMAGMVLATWVAVIAVVVNRIADTAGIGLNKVTVDDRVATHARTFGLLGTYSIPIVLASLSYEALGGEIPLLSPDVAAAARITISGLVMIAANQLVMTPIQLAYGYSTTKIVRSSLADAGMMALGLPYAFLLSFSWCYTGWFGVASFAFAGIVVNAVVRNLALARVANQQLVRRLASLTNIGRSISLDRGTDALLDTIYEECRAVLDSSRFAIALVDEERKMLHVGLMVVGDVRRPQFEIQLGKGFTSWVVMHREPLLMRSVDEDEKRLGLTHVDDGIPAQSWLGVPMIARERVLGVIVVQSEKRAAFDDDDVILLTAIANQAAIALENATFYRDLEQKVEERTAELAEKLNELEFSQGRAVEAERKAREASHTKSAFLANMSHELRTPLNAILGFVQLMFRSPQRAPEDRESLEIISRSGEHLLGLINDVLSISKIESGELMLNSVPFHPQKLLSGLDEMFSKRARAAGIELAIEQSSPLPATVIGDEGKLRQVLINLVGNAVKFTEKGRVTLRVGYSAQRARFEVTDTGPGIRARDRERIFEAFAQSLTGTRGGEGTGLGLAISRSYVGLMGGEIELESEPGAGSTFRFEIPLPPSDEIVAERPARVVRLAPGQPRYRILVAEDRDESRILLVRLMSLVGFDVREATDGAQAVAVWENWKPHLVWMDIRMPVFSGYEATRQIRRREAQRPTDESIDDGAPRRTCIIALTASVFEHDREEIAGAGCDDFVAKPFREEELFEKMRQHIGAEFLHETPAEPASAPASIELTAATLATLSAESRGRLSLALTRGDLRVATEVVDDISRHDPAVGQAISTMLRSYRLDELQGLLEAKH